MHNPKLKVAPLPGWGQTKQVRPPWRLRQLGETALRRFQGLLLLDIRLAKLRAFGVLRALWFHKLWTVRALRVLRVRKGTIL